MLVVKRKRRQSILVGDSIKIKVLSVRGGKVQIGIVAPRDMSIDREERPRGEAPPIDTDAESA